MKNFHCLSISHFHASFEERSLISIQEHEINEFLLQAKALVGLEELLVASTCNRMELYFSTSKLTDVEKIKQVLGSFKGVLSQQFGGLFKHYQGADAVQHLFSVSLGLASRVLGDAQIINQIKRSYKISHELELAGPFLHRLMHTIFYANKRAVQETPIRDGQASLASAATAIANKFSENFTTARLLVVGLGEIGRDVIKNLADANMDITIMNRTKTKAMEAASQFGFRVADIADLENEINEADIVISAVGAPSPIIKANMLKGTPYQKLFIDLSVPGSIEKEVQQKPCTEVYNVDQLANQLDDTLQKRESAIPLVKAIISESIEEFSSWSVAQTYTNSLSHFKEKLNEIRQKELKRIGKHMNATEIEHFNSLTDGMINQIVKLPALQLRSACERGNAENLSGVLKELFDLENLPQTAE